MCRQGCADDVGLALRQLSFLKPVVCVTDWAYRAANLQLNIVKTVIVPLGCAFSDALAAAVKAYIAAKFPSWAGVKVEPNAKYLGFFLGPTCGPLSFLAPAQKWRDRVSDIRLANVGPAIAAHTYNTKCVATVAYQAQLMELPPGMRAQERWVLHSLFKISSSFCSEHFFNWPSLGGPRVDSLQALSFASLSRTVRKTVGGVPEMYERIKRSAELIPGVLGSMKHRKGLQQMPFWTWDSFACHLARALNGDLASPALALARTRADAQIALADTNNARVKIQRIFHKQWFECCVRSSPRSYWGPAITEKLSYLFPELRVELDVLNWSGIFTALAKQPVSIAVCVSKSWNKLWTTSHRLHQQSRLHCVFGCRASRDDLRHYVWCRPLWDAVGRFSGVGPPGDDVLARLCLVDAPSADFGILTAAFHLYHAAKQHFLTFSRCFNNTELVNAARAAWQLVTLSRRSGEAFDLAALF